MKQNPLLKTDLTLISDDFGMTERIYVNLFETFPSYIGIIANYPLDGFLNLLKINGYEKIRSVEYSFDYGSTDIFAKEDYLIEVRNPEDRPDGRLDVRVFYNVKNSDSKEVRKIRIFKKRYYANKEERPKIGIISQTRGGLDVDYVYYDKMQIELKDNYNDDFEDYSKTIINDLKESKHGLHILHGSPGTGKTTFIKYLISTIDKRFIFVPSNLIGSISDPTFLNLLINRAKNCVLILEDAEEALMSTSEIRNSAISNLLNIADGLLGSILNVQILATFNTDFNNIDEAIVRKGRLLSLYEFKKLSANKANVLLERIGSDVKTSDDMSLADIYHINTELNINLNSKNSIKL